MEHLVWRMYVHRGRLNIGPWNLLCKDGEDVLRATKIEMQLRRLLRHLETSNKAIECIAYSWCTLEYRSPCAISGLLFNPAKDL